MNLVNYEPFKAMSRLQDEINQLFHRGEFFSREFSDLELTSNEWSPSVDVKDEEEFFTVSADIPGVDPKDIQVNIDNGVMTVKGERKAKSKEKENGYSRVECSYGRFTRRFTLPDTADTDNIKASGKNGVLEIKIGKRPPSKTRSIKINT
jgi:HSP20 family protein